MSHIIMLIPTETNVGLTSINLGVIRAMEHKKIVLSVFKPIVQFNPNKNALNQTTFHKDYNLTAIEPLTINYVEYLLSNNQKDVLMEKIITNFYKKSKNAEVVLIEGLAPSFRYQFSQLLNYEIAKMLNANIVFVMSKGTDTFEKLKERIKIICNNFGSLKNTNITGIIINKLDAPSDKQDRMYFSSYEISDVSSKTNIIKTNLDELSKNSPIPVLGAVPWNFNLIATRVIDIARYLNATIINEGEIKIRRVKSVTFCSQSVSHMIEYFYPESLLVASSDCPEILITICLAIMSGIEISAILLTGSYEIDPRIRKLCECAFSKGIPILTVNTNTWQTSLKLQNFDFSIPIDDYDRIETIQKYVANYIDSNWIKSLTIPCERSYRISPQAFLYQLTKMARKANKKIVLPEGNEPRTVKAAAICAERGIATCILLGNPDEIKYVAASQSIKLDSSIKIIDPNITRENYVNRLVELRKTKGMTEAIAREQLKDNVVLGTLMLEQNKVDGLVSGAVHTTANTIRPSLQLIKTAPGNSIISSIFFMLLPEQVYVYGDCAINQNPTAEQLAEIAIQSADSALAFGIDPYVAMISYSTFNSSKGSDVDKVRTATYLAQKKRPNLAIDGPLQYDAAVMADVAKSKAPNSPVAGHATVFIFPDLNTGNTTYKAVQRSAELISIGPILQGMRKPVNDLSRGALVSDIVYTIALTAIQSTQK